MADVEHIHKLVKYGSTDELKQYVISQSPNVNLRERICRKTPLMSIFDIGIKFSLQKALLLIRCGADVDMQCCDGDTALMYAFQKLVVTKNTEEKADIKVFITEVLIPVSNLDIQNDYGMTILMYTCMYSEYIDITKSLIKDGANIHLKTKKGFARKFPNTEGSSALVYACKFSNIAAIQLLIQCGANVNSQDEDGITGLMNICMHNKIDYVRMLIEKGADVNILNNNNNNVLMIACLDPYIDIDIIKLLIEKGADTSVINKFGKSCIDICKDTGRIDIVKLLEEHRIGG